MLFKDILSVKLRSVNNEIDNLLDIAYNKQQHKGDLLLIYINGFYQPENLNYSGVTSPYVTGLGKEGLSDQGHYIFIHNYRTTHISDLTYSDYLSQFEYPGGVYNPEKSKEIDLLLEKEEYTIQLEMLIYLKIWEADYFIKKLYEFTRLLNGEAYDWHFNIPHGGGYRQRIIKEEIRNKIQKFSPTLYNLINDSYIPQIRNSIAHSNYSFQARNIHPNNEIKGNKNASIINMPFDQWVDIFHNTLALHNGYIRLNEAIHKFYKGLAVKYNEGIELKINPLQGDPRYFDVFYRKEFNDWVRGK